MRAHTELAWDVAAKAELDLVIDRAPVLVRISAAKRIRDAAERAARRAGETIVSPARVAEAMLEGVGG